MEEELASPLGLFIKPIGWSSIMAITKIKEWKQQNTSLRLEVVPKKTINQIECSKLMEGESDDESENTIIIKRNMVF